MGERRRALLPDAIPDAIGDSIEAAISGPVGAVRKVSGDVGGAEPRLITEKMETGELFVSGEGLLRYHRPDCALGGGPALGRGDPLGAGSGGPPAVRRVPAVSTFSVPASGDTVRGTDRDLRQRAFVAGGVVALVALAVVLAGVFSLGPYVVAGVADGAIYAWPRSASS